MNGIVRQGISVITSHDAAPVLPEGFAFREPVFGVRKVVRESDGLDFIITRNPLQLIPKVAGTKSTFDFKSPIDIFGIQKDVGQSKLTTKEK